MKVLITGATGLFGSYIVDECIKEKYYTRVLVRKNSDLSYLQKYKDIEYSYGSLEDPDSIKEAVKDIDVVIHSAARVSDWGTRQQFIDTNYEATKRLTDICKNNNVKKMIFISSPSVVFHYVDEIMIDESYPYPDEYANFYSEAKALAEKYVIAANEKKGFQSVVLRPHAIWGPRDRTGVIPRVIAKIKAGKFKDFSGGRDVKVDMCFAQNGARACIQAVLSPKTGGKIYFISDDNPVNPWEFFNTLSKRLNIPPISKTINPGILLKIVKIIEIIWKLPFLAKNYAPPLTRYAIGVLTHTTTYDLSAAKNDFKYNPQVTPEKGMDILENWIDKIGGIDEFIKYT